MMFHVLASVFLALAAPSSGWPFSIAGRHEPRPNENDAGRAGVFPGFNHMPTNHSALEAAQDARPDPNAGRILDAACRYADLKGNGVIGQTTLEANCIDSNGLWWDTALNLNECITNVGGKLAYLEDGNFDEWCRPCVIVDLEDKEGLVLKCNCMTEGDLSLYAWLTMGSHVDHPLAVHAYEGQLVCGERKGTKTPYYH